MSNGYDGPYLAGANFDPAVVFANAGDPDAAAADPENAIKHSEKHYAAPTAPATQVDVVEETEGGVSNETQGLTDQSDEDADTKVTDLKFD